MIITTVRGIAQVRKRFTDMRQKFPQRSVRALVKARRATREAFIKELTMETTLNSQRARRLVNSIEPPKVNKLSTAIRVKGDRVGAQHYALQQAASGIVVQFRRDQPAAQYPQAFEWKGNWFQRRVYRNFRPGQRTRRGNLITRAPSGLVGRLPVFRIEGPRATSTLANDQEVRDGTAEAGLSVLEAEIRKALTV